MPAGRAFRRWLAGGAFAACLLSPGLAPAPAGAALVKGDLLVADARAFGGGGLIQVDPQTGAESVFSSNEMAINSSHELFARPYVLAVSDTGRIYVANSTNLGGSCTNGCGGIVEVDPATGAESVLSSNALPVNASSQYFDELTGIGIDPEGNIIVTSWDEEVREGDVIEVNVETGKETLVSSNTMPVNASSRYFTYPQGIVADAAGEIFVADSFAFGGGGGVIEVNPSTGKETEISGNNQAVNASSQLFRAASQLVFDEAGNLVVANWCRASAHCSSLIEVSLATGKETLLSSNEMPVNASSQLFDETTSVAVGESGRMLEVQENGLGGSCNSGAGCGGLVYVDAATGRESELSSNTLPVNAGDELYAEPFDVVEYGVAPWPGPGAGARRAVGAGGAPASSPAAAPTDAHAAGAHGPTIGSLRESRRRWREQRRARHARHARRPASGTVFSFTLSEAATVTLAFSAPRRGRAVHGSCRPASRRARRGRPCTLWKSVGALSVRGRAGRNTVAFGGTLLHGRLLRPGGYRLRASAANAHGSSTDAHALHFTIVR